MFFMPRAEVEMSTKWTVQIEVLGLCAISSICSIWDDTLKGKTQINRIIYTLSSSGGHNNSCLF